MTNNSPFDFTVDKTTKTATINMEFDADLALVWDAFTKPELLDQWIAPKPMTAKTKYGKRCRLREGFFVMIYLASRHLTGLWALSLLAWARTTRAIVSRVPLP